MLCSLRLKSAVDSLLSCISSQFWTDCPLKSAKTIPIQPNQSPFAFYFPINSPLFLIIFGLFNFFLLPNSSAKCDFSARPQPIPIIRVRPKSDHVPNTRKFCLVENSNSFSRTIIYLLFYVIFINTK